MKSKKSKLLFSLCSLLFCIGVMCFGVYSATTATLTLSGTISFEAYKMYVNSITLNNLSPDENGKLTSQTLENFKGVYLNDSSGETEINIGTPGVPVSENLEIEIKLTSLDTTNYQKVTLLYTQPEGYDVRNTSTILQPNPNSVTSGAITGTFKIYVKSDTATDLDISSLNLSIGFEDYGTSLLKYDTTNDYYFVEMGTMPKLISGTNYKSEYIRWRYVTSDLTGYAQATEPNDTTNLSDLTGMYIQETYVDDTTHNVSWENSYIYDSSATPDYHHTETGLEKVKANEYRASNIRKYLNLTNDDVVSKGYSGNYQNATPSGVQSNLCNDLNIDIDSDIIYNQITARPLTNNEGTGLYDNMQYGTSSGGKIECDTSYGVPYENKAGSIDDDGFDKFWLPSYYEMYKLFTNDSGGNTTGDCLSRVWHTQSGSAVSYYWLRSPSSSNSRYAYYVNSSGNFYNGNVVYNNNVCRAAFQIS